MRGRHDIHRDFCYKLRLSCRMKTGEVSFQSTARNLSKRCEEFFYFSQKKKWKLMEIFLNDVILLLLGSPLLSSKWNNFVFASEDLVFTASNLFRLCHTSNESNGNLFQYVYYVVPLYSKHFTLCERLNRFSPQGKNSSVLSVSNSVACDTF